MPSYTETLDIKFNGEIMEVGVTYCHEPGDSGCYSPGIHCCAPVDEELYVESAVIDVEGYPLDLVEVIPDTLDKLLKDKLEG